MLAQGSISASRTVTGGRGVAMDGDVGQITANITHELLQQIHLYL
jgi:hypothetical protein